MSWIISLVVAGLMFTSEGNLPVTANHNFTKSKPSVENTNRFDETERFAQTYPLSSNGRVSVSNVNGSVTVDTWDRNEVKLEYIKTADTKENLAEVEIKIDARQDAFSVETDYGDWRRRNSGERRNYGKLQIEYRLTVPRNAVLNEIATVNGSVSITGGGSLTKASSVNGQVRAVNLRGTANLSTVNGTVEADFDQLQTGSRISLNTVNGTVNLVVPSDANATVKADTVNGNIANDFGLPVRKGEYVGRDLYGKIGNGDVQIRLNSVNGTLSVKRRNDGKNANPVTNLLTTRNENNWNDGEDSEVNLTVRPPRPPRAPRPPKPPRNSGIDNDELNKTIEQSIKDAEKELKNIEPELEKTIKEGLREAAKVNSAEVRAQLKEALAQISAANWSTGAPSIEEKSDSFPVKGIPKVTVEARNCAVSVRGWDKSEVSYSMVRISRNNQKQPLNTDSAISVKAGDSDVSIKISAETSSPGGIDSGGVTKTRIEIFVPKKSNLKVITNREIRLEGVSGEIDLQGADESINVRDVDGKLSVGTSDGKIRVIGFKGEINTKTSSGATNLEGDFRGLSARTVDGTITLTLPENANANIESNRKDIVGEGVSLVYQGDGKSTSTWKIGSGGENHLLYTSADGRVIVRSVKHLQN
ncbi:MAG TPA: DUF4097 family beta strand repeat-containing protein [Pyrinomonadaceae bacterium]|nr:DUF4097 family beta strand repeat-containing protein [Pyrinomonadaceae bacterium]